MERQIIKATREQTHTHTQAQLHMRRKREREREDPLDFTARESRVSIKLRVSARLVISL